MNTAPAASAQRRLGATITGSGERVIVLANGLGTSQRTWRHVVDALDGRARFVRFDNVCSPAAPPGGYRAEVYSSIYAYVDDAVQLITELDLRDVLFVGHSISGIIGLLAAVTIPDHISRLALICSTPRYLEDVDFRAGFPRDRLDAILLELQTNYAGWARTFAESACGPDATPEQWAELADGLAGMPPDVAFRVFQLVFFGDARAILPRVRQPVFVMHSQEDLVVPSSAGEYMVQQIPRAQLVPLSAKGHLPQLTRPAEIVRHLSRILDTWT
ncbi:MAG TPA: alpha/beta hydrolase [Gemmatimonadaceae bacterium]|nr:alpha/beta hydrolase [Gemmatimonadaceae bacterium]